MSGTASAALPAGFTLDPAPPPAAAQSAPAVPPASQSASSALPDGFTLDPAPVNTDALGMAPARTVASASTAQPSTDPGTLGMQTAPAAPTSDPNRQPAKTSWLDDVIHTGVQDTTLGLGDKIAAAGYAAAEPYLPGQNGSNASTYSQRYDDNLAAERTREAGESYSATIPGHVLGLAGMVAGSATGLPEAVGAATGINKLLSVAAPVTDAVGDAAGSVLARLPGGSSIIAPIAKGATMNAAVGAAAGGADADGGIQDHIQGALTGAATGAVLGGAGSAAVTAAKPVLKLGRAIYADLGKGAKVPLTDANGQLVSAPVTASQADQAAQLIQQHTSDPQAATAALDQHLSAPATVPGFAPTAYQVTGDAGQGQLEQGVRVANPDQFLSRQNQQNSAIVGAIDNNAPSDAFSDAITPVVQGQAAAIDQSGQAAIAAAQTGRNQAVAALPPTTDATPEEAGAALRGQIDQARAPAIQAADTSLQDARQTAQTATGALGGQVPVGPDGQTTALQDFGIQFRQTLSDAQAAHLAPTQALYQQLGQDGTKALDVTPLKQASSDILASMPQSAILMGPDEARLHDLVAGYPQVQSLGELQALESAAKTIQAKQRGPDGDPQAVHRIGQLLDGITDTQAKAIEGASDPVPAATPTTPTGTAAPGVGNTVYTPSGQPVGVQYEVAPASSLITSHTDGLDPNPAFPAEMQPRDRGRAASQAQVTSISNRLQPERLGASTTASDGAPIVGPDNVVESGNARTIALRRAYAANGQQAAAYRDFLAAQGHDTAGIDQPVLIRRRTSPMTPEQRVAFTREANGSNVLAPSAGEVARTDAQRITPDLLDLHASGDVADPANRNMVRAFARDVVSPQEQGAFATADGQLSRDGAQRMRNALTARAYGDHTLTDALAETGDPRTRVLASALEQAAPDMARLRMGIERGEVDPSVDLSPHVSQALAALRVARDQRIPLADVVQQGDAFSRMSSEAVKLLHSAYGPALSGRMSAEAAAEMLRHYARVAGEQSTEARLFGENLGSGQILEEAGARYGRQAAGAGSTRAFASNAPARTGDDSDGYSDGGPLPGAGRQENTGRSRLGRARYPADALPGAEAPALTPNFTSADADTLRAAHAGYRANKETFARAPGVGEVLADHPGGRGGYKLADSQVPAQLFGRGPKGAERVQAAIKAGIDPEDLSSYVAANLRAAAERPDGTLDPAKFETWRTQNREAFDALTRAVPAIGKRFASAEQASRQLDALQAQRDAIDKAHPLAAGTSNAEVAKQAVTTGQAGRERVQSMLRAAGNTDEAKQAVENVIAHLYDGKVIKDGEVDRGAHDRFVQAYKGALSAVPGLAEKFGSAAKAQDAVTAASDAHAAAMKAYQKSAARFFLGGGDPAERIGQVLATPNRVADMAALRDLTANDPAARDGLKRAVVEFLQKRFLSPAGPGGEQRVRSAAMRKFVADNGKALETVFSPNEMASFGHIADALGTMDQSVTGARLPGGSDTVQKAIAAMKAGGKTPFVAALKQHAAEAVGGLSGAKIGTVLGGVPGGLIGSIIGTAGGKAVQSMRAANIQSVDDLVTEAMLNPGLMRVLIARPNNSNGGSIGKTLVGQLGKLALVQATQSAAGTGNRLAGR